MEFDPTNVRYASFRQYNWLFFTAKIDLIRSNTVTGILIAN